jgi:hypothetical protein
MIKKIVELKGQVTRKDLAYWIIFLIGFNIFALSGKLSHDTTLINYIGFAGTLLSIVLAIIAIIYSYFQSSSFENTKFKLDQSVEKIEEASSSLSKMNKIEELTASISASVNNFETNLASSITDLQSGLTQLAGTFEERLHLFTVSMGGQFSSVLSRAEETQNDLIELKKITSGMKSNQINNNFNMNFKNINFTVITYYFYLLYKSQKDIDLMKFSIWLLENECSLWSASWLKEQTDHPKNNTYGFIFGVLSYSFYFDWIEIKQDKITTFNEDLEQLLIDSNQHNKYLSNKIELLKQFVESL